MNASYDWLRSLVPVTLSPAELRDLITAHTATVDELVPLRGDLKDVVIGLVVEAAPHPDSDHLWVTRVDAGSGELIDVVCGAANVRAGRKYPFAPSGTTLPGGLKLERRKIRGAVSNGMLCSARELALGDEHEGILDLDTPDPPGTPFLRAQLRSLSVGDTRIVIDVGANRADLHSHLGLAREIAAVTGLAATLPAIAPRGAPPLPNDAAAVVRPPARPPHAAGAYEKRTSGVAGGVTVELRDVAGCLHYSGVVLRGVSVGPSPRWLVDRLAAVGARSINNVVDVTNYMVHEVGQPMHAFDLARLHGPAVIVRAALPGEQLTTLDGVARALDPSVTVIADASRAQGVAGVIGGQDSEVTGETTGVFLEVATFDRTATRRTRRTLGLSTDASYRFERGTDWAAAPRWLERAVELLRSVAGGEVAGEPVHLYAGTLRPPPNVRLRVSRVAHLLGVDVPREEIVALLQGVGFAVDGRGADELVVSVPTWRYDVTREVDLIEEVARLRGYDSFPDELRPFRPSAVPDSPLELLSRRVRDTLAAAGLLEARPLPFVKGDGGAAYVRVTNPLAENESYLRRDLLETLARRAEYNLAHRRRDVRLFEIGSAFLPAGAPLPREELRAAAILMGHRHPPHWTEPHTPDFDEWDARGLAELMARSAGAREWSLTPGVGDVLWHVVLDGEPQGEVRRLALDAPVWAPAAYGVEISLATIDSANVAPPGQHDYTRAPSRSPAASSARAYRPLPTTPAAEFDLALLIPNDLPAARVEQTMRAVAGDLLESLTLFDEYRGEGVPDGYRSVAWRLTLRHPERTLRDKEITGRRDKLLRTLEGELGVRQRSS